VNNWKVIFATVVIFGAGVITGGLLVNYVQKCGGKAGNHSKPAAVAETRPVATNQAPRAADATRPFRPSDILSKQFLQALDLRLSLTPEERAAIQKIIGERQSQIRRTVMDARLEIRELLTPEQRTEFDELVKRPVRKPNPGTNGVAVPPATSGLSPTNTP
jgi:hypothetical protein